jgi:hypothetical protein
MDTKEKKKCKYTDTFATSDLIIKLLCGQKFLMYLEWDESFLFSWTDTCITHIENCNNELLEMSPNQTPMGDAGGLILVK